MVSHGFSSAGGHAFLTAIKNYKRHVGDPRFVVVVQVCLVLLCMKWDTSLFLI